MDSVAAKEANLIDKEKDKEVRKKGKEHVHVFANYVDRFGKDVAKLEKLLGHKEKLGCLVVDIKSTKSKTNALENTRKGLPFHKASKKRSNVIAAETTSEGVPITSVVGK